MNPGFADSKPIRSFMVSSIKRVPETPRDSVVNSNMSFGNDCTGLRHRW